MDKIWKHDKLYFMLRPYVDWCTRRSFTSIHVEGRSSIPNDGAVFLAPNHCNTLLDALVILQCFKGAMAFGARADIFKKPKVAKILHFLKMVPLARMRDGAKAIEENLHIQHEVADIAKHGIPFCIFAEGTHRPSYEVMPTKKGVWRLSNLTRESSKHPVYIVPVGLSYQYFFRFPAEITVRFGEAIDVSSTDDLSFAEKNNLLQDRIQQLVIPYKPAEPHTAFGGIMLLPMLIFWTILALPTLIPGLIFENRLKDKAWTNTVYFGLRLVLTPICSILFFLAGFFIQGWWLAVILSLASIWADTAFHWHIGFYKDLLLS